MKSMMLKPVSDEKIFFSFLKLRPQYDTISLLHKGTCVAIKADFKRAFDRKKIGKCLSLNLVFIQFDFAQLFSNIYPNKINGTIRVRGDNVVIRYLIDL